MVTRSVVRASAAVVASSSVVATVTVTPSFSRSSATARLPVGSAERGSRVPWDSVERIVASAMPPIRIRATTRAAPRARVQI